MLTKLKYIFYVLLIIIVNSCGMKGPNYNQGTSHNANRQNRSKIVNKEDSRMKKGMLKHRSKSRPKKIIKHKKKNKRYI